VFVSKISHKPAFERALLCSQPAVAPWPMARPERTGSPMNKPEPTAERTSAPNRRDVEAVLGAGGAPRPWFSRAVAWTVVALLVVAVVAGYWLWGSAQSAVRYTTEPATRGNLTVIVTATGSA